MSGIRDCLGTTFGLARNGIRFVRLLFLSRAESAARALRKAKALFRFLPDSLDRFGLLVGQLGKVLSRDETKVSYRLVASGISLLLASNFARQGRTEESVD